MSRIIRYKEGSEWKNATVADVGEILNLKTDVKTDLVSAINSIVEGGGVGSGSGGTTGTDTDYEASMNELRAELERLDSTIVGVSASVNDMLGYQEAMSSSLDTISTNTENMQTEISTVKTDLDKVELDLTDIGNKYSQTVTDFELMEVEVQKAKSDILEKVDYSEYKESNDSVVAQLSSKASNIDVTNLTSRVTDVETTLVTQEGELSSKISRTEYDTAFGVDRWIATKYMIDIGAANVIPTPNHIKGVNQSQAIDYDDTVDFNAFSGSKFVTQYFTNIYSNITKTITFSVINTDSFSIYLNGASIISRTNAQTTLLEISLVLQKGWNTIEVYQNHYIDNENKVSFNVALKTLVDKLSYHIGVGTKNDTRLSIAESSIKQNADSIALSVANYTTLAGTVTDNKSRLEILEDEISTKVSNTTFNEYSSRLSTAESTIVQQANSIATKVSQTDYNTLNDIVDSHTSTITSLSDSIALKVSTESFNGLEGRVSANEGSITVLENSIALKVDSTEFNEANGLLTEIETYLGLDENGVSSVATKTEFDSLNNTVTNMNTTLTQTASSLTSKADKTDTYTKDEVNAKITDVNTLIEQNAESISLKANQVDVYTKPQVDGFIGEKADNSTVANLAERVTETESSLTIQAGQIASKVTQTEINNAINSLDVNGKNLLLNSKVAKTNISYPTATYEMSEKMVADTNYTVRLKGSLGAGKDSFDAYLNGETIRLGSLTDNGDGTFFLTFKGVASDSSVEKDYIGIYPISDNVSATSSIEWIKLEKGNQYTDYTQSPEDVDNELTSLKNRVTKTETDIIQTASDITLKASKSDVDSAISTAKAEIKVTTDSITNTVSNVSSELDTFLGGSTTTLEQLNDSITLKANTTTVDELTSRVSSAESLITQNTESITAKVSKTDFDTLESRVEYAESSITQTATEISSKVSKDGIISAINQSAESVSILASKINLTGAVTFNSLDSSTQSVINTASSDASSAISTASSASSKVNGWASSSDSTFIDGGKIYTNSITANKINVDTLSALSANLGIVTAGTISGVTINGATINGGTINVSTDIQVGNRIKLGTSDWVTDKYLIFNDTCWIGGRGDVITFSTTGGMVFDSTTTFTSYVDFTNATVQGLDFTAKFG